MARAKSNTTTTTENMNSQTFEKTKPSMFASQQPEQNFQRSFEPLTSRTDGKAQLTFSGYKHTVRNDGNGAFLQIVFAVMDVTGKNPANISVNSNYKYSDGNTLGRLLKLMGYNHESRIIVTDQDDEFGYSINEDLNQIYAFLDSKKGLVFKGFCNSEENIKGEFWYRIKVDSIENCLDKTGMQKRSYDSSEGLCEKELSIDIEARGGDDN